MLIGGCGTKRPLAPKITQIGYVDVARLAPGNPSWSKVVFYDRMIAALPPETSPIAWHGPEAATLPAIAVSQETRTDLALDDQRRRLEQVRNREIVELTQRLSEARDYRLRVEAYGWRRDQKVKTDAEIERLNAEYTDRVAAETQKADVRLLNLKLQVDALRRLTIQWALSTPPSPELVQAKAELGVKEKELAAAEDAQSNLFIELRAEHRRQLAQAVRAGADAVDAIRTQKEAEYRTADAREIERAKTRLQSGITSVLDEVAAAERRTWIQSIEPPAKSVSYQWPQPPVAVLKSQKLEERERLMAAKQHWVDYVYTNTRLAAADVAAKQHWQISFLSPGTGRAPGMRDMTPQVAAALSADLWKIKG